MSLDRLTLPAHYHNKLDLRETETAIKIVKDHFQSALANALHLQRVSAPLCVFSGSGLNDDLNGVERAVRFDVPDTGKEAEIVHSLAKWKRAALARYGFSPGEGLYTDMNAIRRDEVLDNTHSMYVDQWDWEKIITPQERTEEFLKQTVRTIFQVLKDTEDFICGKYPKLERLLPDETEFITTQQLEDRWPTLTPHERETMIAREKKAVFLMQIGGALRSGMRHDGRAPDYDDWTLNGDIIVYYPILDMGLELSSMGIRVDAEALTRQLALAGCPERANMPFHASLLSGQLPLTMGGGIGQSRICMFFLNKAHVGEVQASLWDEESIRRCAEHGIPLL